MPAPNITTALENSLDMCFSALYIHEVKNYLFLNFINKNLKLHRKFHHGDYIDLDNVKEENDDETDGENLFEMNQKRPLLEMNDKRSQYNKEIETESEDDNNANNLTLTNYNDNTYLTSNQNNGLKLSHNQPKISYHSNLNL